MEKRRSRARGSDLIVIAHRGASGYLPEHTLPAKTLAFGMGADFLEQDVVLTRDGHPIVLHDIHLDTVTDVAHRFPARCREDGRFYAIDFTLAEIQSLAVHERCDLATGLPIFPTRFPLDRSSFRIPTLQEEIELVQGLMRSTRRSVGIYPEIKAPAWHRQQGQDISRIVWQVLGDYGYTLTDDTIFVQCFDGRELRRWRDEFGSRLPLIQLIHDATDAGDDVLNGESLTPAGLRDIAEYADGIGPALTQMVLSDGTPTDVTANAHALELVVHPYTVRLDRLPEFASDHDSLLELLVRRAGVDGVFTDFPDLAVQWRCRTRGEVPGLQTS